MSREPTRRAIGAPIGLGWAVCFACIFLVFIGAGTGLRVWTADRQQRESQRLASRWSAAEAESLTQRVHAELEDAEQVLHTLDRSRHMIGPEILPLDRAAAMAAFLDGFESFSFLYAGLPDGSSFGAQRLLSGRVEVFTREPSEPGILWDVTDEGQLTKKQQVDPVPFDPRQTRWFQSAREAEHVVWSQPYTGIGASSIVTASLDSGSMVFGVDLSLAGIADAINQGQAGAPRSSVYVLNLNRNPITGLARSVRQGDQVALDLFLRSGPDELARLNADSPTVRIFESQGQGFVGAIRPLKLGEELLGAVVLLTPRAEISPEVQLRLVNHIALALIFVGLVAGVAAMASLSIGLGRMLMPFTFQERSDSAEGEAGPAEGAVVSEDRVMPKGVWACFRCGAPEDAAAVACRAKDEEGFEVVGQLDERLVLRARDPGLSARMIDVGLELAKSERHAVGLAYERLDGKVRPAALAESLASTGGCVQVSECFAQILAARYEVYRRGRMWIDGVHEINVFTVESGS